MPIPQALSIPFRPVNLKPYAQEAPPERAGPRIATPTPNSTDLRLLVSKGKAVETAGSQVLAAHMPCPHRERIK